jgi:hypothetical protein
MRKWCPLQLIYLVINPVFHLKWVLIYKRISWSIAAENKKKVGFFLFQDLEIAENFCSESDDQEMHNFLIWHFEDHVVAGISL